MKLLVTLKPQKYNSPYQSYGTLAEIDWEKKQIIRSLRIPTASFQDETAFMACTLGGLCTIGHRVFVAAWNFVVEIDYDSFEIVNAVSWPSMADLHGMATDGRHIWVASTAIDALLCLDGRTLQFKWRWGPDEPILWHDRPANGTAGTILERWPTVNRFVKGLVRNPVNRRFVEREYRYVHKSKSPYHYHHLNDVCFHDGELLMSTKGWNNDGNRSAVIKLDPESRRSEFFVPPGGFRGMHDGVFVDGRFYTTESGANSVAWREPNGTIYSRKIEPSPYFVRGLCFTGTSFLIGFSTFRGTDLPAKIVEYDLELTHCGGSMDVSDFYTKGHLTLIHAITLSP